MKLRTSILAVGTSLALVASPALAQDDATPTEPQSEAEMFETMQAMFPKDPLTAEEQSRLPMAAQIIDKMIPPGTFAEMMGGMFDSMMGPIMEMAASNPKGDVARMLGMEASDLQLGEEQVVELAGILDPVWKERNAAIAGVMPELMKGMMATMEPPMRKAMTEAYAIYFNETELADIDAFFSTPSGLSYARKSFTMASDPRIMAASMEALPAMMESFAELETKMEAATADLPQTRGWEDLSATQRARLAELTGLEQSELEANMAFAAELEAMESEAAE